MLAHTLVKKNIKMYNQLEKVLDYQILQANRIAQQFKDNPKIVYQECGKLIGLEIAIRALDMEYSQELRDKVNKFIDTYCD